MSKFKCGFVSILGRPNVGKSTLLNNLLGQKVSIISKVPQTTRYIIRAILNKKDVQIVFVDTPGIHIFKDTLSSQLNTLSLGALEGVEVILYVVDCTRPPHREEEKIMNTLVRQKIPLVMALNKIDKSKKYAGDYIQLWQQKSKKESCLEYFIPISGLRGRNLDKLIDAIVEFLPESEPFYDKDTLTDFPLIYRVSDIIREKLCRLLKDELPHNLAVEVGDINQTDTLVKVYATILAAKKSQKLIVVGEKGSMIKEIGTQSRRDLEALFNKKVFLDLWVKIEKDWFNKTRILRELGYTGI
jgi:GTP-binding protein Era